MSLLKLWNKISLNKQACLDTFNISPAKAPPEDITRALELMSEFPADDTDKLVSVGRQLLRLHLSQLDPWPRPDLFKQSRMASFLKKHVTANFSGEDSDHCGLGDLFVILLCFAYFKEPGQMIYRLKVFGSISTPTFEVSDEVLCLIRVYAHWVQLLPPQQE